MRVFDGRYLRPLLLGWMTHGGWGMEDGGWGMEDGGWRMEDRR